MPITMCGAGNTAVVRKLGGKNETRRFLETLGFTPGASVTVVSDTDAGVVLAVRGSRVALDRTVAQGIIV